MNVLKKRVPIWLTVVGVQEKCLDQAMTKRILDVRFMAWLKECDHEILIRSHTHLYMRIHSVGQHICHCYVDAIMKTPVPTMQGPYQQGKIMIGPRLLETILFDAFKAGYDARPMMFDLTDENIEVAFKHWAKDIA